MSLFDKFSRLLTHFSEICFYILKILSSLDYFQFTSLQQILLFQFLFHVTYFKNIFYYYNSLKASKFNMYSIVQINMFSSGTSLFRADKYIKKLKKKKTNTYSRGFYFGLLFELFVKIVLQIVKVSDGNFVSARSFGLAKWLSIGQIRGFRTENCDIQIG